MAKIGRVRAARLVLLLCVVLSAASAVFLASVANAGPSDGLRGPVGEVTDPVTAVQEVTDTRPPPVGEVTETVTPPVHETTETVAPPVHEAAETVTPPVDETTEKVTQPPEEAAETVRPAAKQAVEAGASAPVKAAAGTAAHTAANGDGSSSGAAAKTSGRVVKEATGTAAGGYEGAVESLTHAGPSSSLSHVPATGVTAGASSGTTPRGHATIGNAPDLGPGADTFAVPSIHGAVRSPLDKLVAYVWPAIALADPVLAHLLEGPGRQNFLVALYEMGGGPDAGQIEVSAASAEGTDQAGDGKASSSPSFLSSFPRLLGTPFTASAPLPLPVALIAIALLVALLVLTVLWEVGVLQDRRRWNPLRRHRRRRAVHTWGHRG